MSVATDRAWAAGILDGEGCIIIAKDYKGTKRVERFRLKVQVSMTHQPTIDRLHVMFGGSRHNHTPQNSQWRQRHYVILCGEQAEQMLRKVLPYLTAKKEEALVALDFRKLSVKERTARGARFKAELERLKRVEWPAVV